MQNNNKQRRDFLKRIPLAIVSITALSVFRIKQSKKNSEMKFYTISMSEANDILKVDKLSPATKIKPKPPPVAQRNIKV
ncbi:MAG: hypothetical protein QM503_15910 [Bacteroidota bacterium]